MINIRGQNLVSRTNGDPLPHPCVCTKRPPCVDSKRHRVYRHHAHMLKHMFEWCRRTRGRFECTHGGRFVHTHTGFFTFFQRAATNTHTPNTHSDHQQHHDHNDTHHTTPQHTTPHGDRDRERQRETETEKERQRKRDKKREEQRRRDKKREETRK